MVINVVFQIVQLKVQDYIGRNMKDSSLNHQTQWMIYQTNTVMIKEAIKGYAKNIDNVLFVDLPATKDTATGQVRIYGYIKSQYNVFICLIIVLSSALSELPIVI